MKKLLKAFFVLTVLVHALLLYFGLASVTTAFCAYVLLTFLFLGLTQKLFSRNTALSKIQLSIVAFIASLFVAEVLLHYVFKTHLSYPEQNGAFFYTSQYRQIVPENLIHHFIRGQNDLTLRVHTPHSNKKLNKPEFNYSVQYNLLGLRGSEPKKNRPTLVALGDSYTEGVGAPADSTWVQLLQEELKATDPNIQCLNGGSSGSDPFYEWMIFKKLLLSYKPQTVVLAINESDITETIVRGGMERFDNNWVSYRQPPWWEYIYSWSFIVRNIAHRVFNVNYLLLTPTQYEQEKQVALYKITQCLLKYYLPAAQQQHFKLIVVLHPKKQELLKHETPFGTLAKTLQQHNVTVVDLYHVFENKFSHQPKALDSLYWSIDLHHTPAGYHLWAQTLLPFVTTDSTRLAPNTVQ